VAGSTTPGFGLHGGMEGVVQASGGCGGCASYSVRRMISYKLCSGGRHMQAPCHVAVRYA